MNLEEVISKIIAFNKKITTKLEAFQTGCRVLEESSHYEYRIQKTINLNKIYFQGYVLNSKLCQDLQSKGINDYSLNTLKNYINENFNNFSEDYTSYYEALSLYEKANEIERLSDSKAKLAMDFLSNYIPDIKSWPNIKQEILVSKYQEIKEKITSLIKKKDLIEEKTLENEVSKMLFILDDLFNYFRGEYPIIINN